MNSQSKVPLMMRIFLLIASWLIAGFVYATCAEFSVEGGDSMLATQTQMVCIAPLVAAEGLAFTVVPGGYNAWQGRQLWEGIVSYVLLAMFLVVAGVLLTRRTQRQFVLWPSVQLGLLSLSIVAVLYYFHWDAIHMHG